MEAVASLGQPLDLHAPAHLKRFSQLLFRQFARALFLAMFCNTAPSLAEQADVDPGAPEVRVKAAFLYKFASYIEWPEAAFASRETPITIGVEDDDPLFVELTKVTAGRKVADRELQVIKLAADAVPSGVHIAFIANTRLARARTAALRAQPMLVVTDYQGALNANSTINFVVVDGHLRFEISLDDANRRGLKLSARLLAVAQDVRLGGSR
jgi:hypothetical protein